MHQFSIEIILTVNLLVLLCYIPQGRGPRFATVCDRRGKIISSKISTHT